MLIPKKNRREVYKYLFKGACCCVCMQGKEQGARELQRKVRNIMHSVRLIPFLHALLLGLVCDTCGWPPNTQTKGAVG